MHLLTWPSAGTPHSGSRRGTVLQVSSSRARASPCLLLPKASPNDRFVALELLKNANIAAAGVLPGCQDTGARARGA